MSYTLEELIELSKSKICPSDQYYSFIVNNKSSNNLIKLIKGLIEQEYGEGLSCLISTYALHDDIVISDILDKKDYDNLIDILYRQEDYERFVTLVLFTTTRYLGAYKLEFNETMIEYIVDKYSSKLLLDRYNYLVEQQQRYRKAEANRKI